MITRLGLTARAIAFCVLLVLGAVGTMSAVLIRQNYADSQRRVTQQAVSHARSISRSAAHAILLNDEENVRRILRAAGSDDALQLACVRGPSGHELAPVEYKRNEDYQSELESALDAANPMGRSFQRGDVRVERSRDELLAIFLNDLPRLTGAVESAASQADAAGLNAAAHSLKGAASNICAEPTRRVAQRLEKMGQQGELVDVDALVGELHDHLERLREFAAPLYAT